MSAFEGRAQPVSATPLVVYRQGFEPQGLAGAWIEPPRDPVNSGLARLEAIAQNWTSCERTAMAAPPAPSGCLPLLQLKNCAPECVSFPVFVFRLPVVRGVLTCGFPDRPVGRGLLLFFQFGLRGGASAASAWGALVSFVCRRPHHAVERGG
jgi:hypothetical protein